MCEYTWTALGSEDETISNDLEDVAEEIWRDIPKYEGMYQVSNLGRVRSLDRAVTHAETDTYHKSNVVRYKGKILAAVHPTPYKGKLYGPKVTLFKSGRRFQVYIRSLLYQTFTSSEIPDSVKEYVDY